VKHEKCLKKQKVVLVATMYNNTSNREMYIDVAGCEESVVLTMTGFVKKIGL
jgi:hypothetical protein